VNKGYILRSLLVNKRNHLTADTVP